MALVQFPGRNNEQFRRFLRWKMKILSHRFSTISFPASFTIHACAIPGIVANYRKPINHFREYARIVNISNGRKIGNLTPFYYFRTLENYWWSIHKKILIKLTTHQLQKYSFLFILFTHNFSDTISVFCFVLVWSHCFGGSLSSELVNLHISVRL